MEPTWDRSQTLSMLVHGDSKVGKSWLGTTTPAPRLILDAEGGQRWTPGSKVYWDPSIPPPAADGTWESCIVIIRTYADVQRVYQWLITGQHEFRSIVIDSISEIQKRAKDSIANLDSMKQQQWGELLTHMERLIRDFRDLTMHPKNPVQAVVMIAFTRQVDGKYRPYVQGQLGVTMPYFLDIIGFYYVHVNEDNSITRKLLVQNHPNFEAGERVGGRLGAVVDHPDVTDMIARIYTTEA